MLEIPLPHIQTGRGRYDVRIGPTGVMEWSTIPFVWTPAPVLWRLGKTFRNHPSDQIAGVHLTMQQMTDWANKLSVFPSLMGGMLFTFTRPFWWGRIHPAVFNPNGSGTNDALARMDMLPVTGALDLGRLSQYRPLNHDIRNLLKWANANNGELAVHLDQWLLSSGYQLKGR